jgi:murein DD-endopeptidase MepM/ murein hydrolase activator NlpD
VSSRERQRSWEGIGLRLGGTVGTECEVATLVLALIEDVVDSTRRRETSGLVASPPLATGARVMARFGHRPGYRPTPYTFHGGLDFHVERGAPVFAVRPGVVQSVLRNAAREEGCVGYGNAVVLHHVDEDTWTFSAHLDEVLVLPGMQVVAGQLIGRAGNSTNGRLPDMVPRLHFEVRVRGADGRPPFPGPLRLNSRDPEPWLRSHGISIDPDGALVDRANAASTPPSERSGDAPDTSGPLTPFPFKIG